MQLTRNRDFMLLWQGQAVSQIGSQAFLIAVMYWTMETSGSASTMGILMALQTIPLIVLGPISGTIADWFRRKHILIYTDLICGVSVLSLSLALLVFSDQLTVVIGWIYTTALVLGICKALFEPAVTAAIPDIVPEASVAAANSMRMFSGQSATILGQALGGFLYPLIGAPFLLLLDGISYFASALSESFIRLPYQPPETSTQSQKSLGAFRSDVREGFRFVFGLTGAGHVLVTAAVVNTLVTPVIVLLPFHVDAYMSSSAAWYGLLLGALSGGSILGYLCVSTGLIRPEWRAWILSVSFVCAPGLLGILGHVSNALVGVVVMAASGLFAGMINIFVLTLFQISSPKNMRGRVMSFVIMVTGSAAPVGMLIGGILGDVLDQNTPLIFGLCGGFAGVASLIGACFPAYRTFLSR